ncbi:hypothetical protein [Thiomicrorhabdus heinhorstiae]|uniref:Flp pilus-assembly TadG-like N-terminal domain-containing protein n=1 Tax=Thiomicrorhabdus heinhorstiae TaxID=2748010 RepID=A0ABS0BXY8_9GAMM|nr:hypothetical protein [Thiomicrorhabdus heinhorstiae]MBF6058650.1 hypothetical protein [Thiomicrorhabdus heinhorstiae]
MRSLSFKRQQGAVTFFVISSLITAVLGFGMVMEYAKLKIIDRELDNYARTIAEAALRSELSITRTMLEEGTVSANQTSQVAEAILARSGYVVEGGDSTNRTIHKKITFGNFSDSEACKDPNSINKEGCFIPLGSNSENPKAAEPPPEFSAVAVQLWTDDYFYGFVPQGRALFGLMDDEEDCYCDTRYKSCLDADFSVPDLVGVEPAQFKQAIRVKGSVARQNYCEYGYAPPHPAYTDNSKVKYPWVDFHSGWIGQTPSQNSVLLGLLYTDDYTNSDFMRVLSQMNVAVEDGDDPLDDEGGLLYTVGGLLDLLAPSSQMVASNQDGSTMQASDIEPDSISNQNQYRCSLTNVSVDLINLLDTGGLLTGPCGGLVNAIGQTLTSITNGLLNGLLGGLLGGLGGLVIDVTDPNILFSDTAYVGRSGTCTPYTDSDNVNSDRCFWQNTDGGIYQSCETIMHSNPNDMNFQDRLTAFLLGPFIDWEKAYEGLNCEISRFKYKGWLFWGGWEAL